MLITYLEDTFQTLKQNVESRDPKLNLTNTESFRQVETIQNFDVIWKVTCSSIYRKDGDINSVLCIGSKVGSYSMGLTVKQVFQMPRRFSKGC